MLWSSDERWTQRSHDNKQQYTALPGSTRHYLQPIGSSKTGNHTSYRFNRARSRTMPHPHAKRVKSSSGTISLRLHLRTNTTQQLLLLHLLSLPDQLQQIVCTRSLESRRSTRLDRDQRNAPEVALAIIHDRHRWEPSNCCLCIETLGLLG